MNHFPHRDYIFAGHRNKLATGKLHLLVPSIVAVSVSIGTMTREGLETETVEGNEVLSSIMQWNTMCIPLLVTKYRVLEYDFTEVTVSESIRSRSYVVMGTRGVRPVKELLKDKADRPIALFSTGDTGSVITVEEEQELFDRASVVYIDNNSRLPLDIQPHPNILHMNDMRSRSINEKCHILKSSESMVELFQYYPRIIPEVIIVETHNFDKCVKYHEYNLTDCISLFHEAGSKIVYRVSSDNVEFGRAHYRYIDEIELLSTKDNLSLQGIEHTNVSKIRFPLSVEVGNKYLHYIVEIEIRRNSSTTKRVN